MMGSRHILDQIQFRIRPDYIAKHVGIKKENPYFQILENMAHEAEKIARPKGLYKTAFIEKKGDDKVIIDQVKFTSRVLKVNLENIHRVFPFVATCGNELNQWSQSFTGIFESFVADVLKTIALQSAVKAVDAHIGIHYGSSKVSRMSPGSIGDWPITEQQLLFKLLGDVNRDIGLKLLDSLMMNPVQSVSGIIFPTETKFESCQLCSRQNCPGRRAAYDKNLYEKKYKLLNRDKTRNTS